MERDKTLTLFLVTPDLDILCSFNWHISVTGHVSTKGTKPTPKAVVVPRDCSHEKRVSMELGLEREADLPEE